MNARRTRGGRFTATIVAAPIWAWSPIPAAGASAADSQILRGPESGDAAGPKLDRRTQQRTPPVCWRRPPLGGGVAGGALPIPCSTAVPSLSPLAPRSGDPVHRDAAPNRAPARMTFRLRPQA